MLGDEADKAKDDDSGARWQSSSRHTFSLAVRSAASTSAARTWRHPQPAALILEAPLGALSMRRLSRPTRRSQSRRLAAEYWRSQGSGPSDAIRSRTVDGEHFLPAVVCDARNCTLAYLSQFGHPPTPGLHVTTSGSHLIWDLPTALLLSLVPCFEATRTPALYNDQRKVGCVEWEMVGSNSIRPVPLRPQLGDQCSPTHLAVVPKSPAMNGISPPCCQAVPTRHAKFP